MIIYQVYMAWALIIATGLLVRLLLGPRCAHAWELVDKVEFCSTMEHITKYGYKFNDLRGDAITDVSKRSVTIVMRCPKCGKAMIEKITS